MEKKGEMGDQEEQIVVRDVKRWEYICGHVWRDSIHDAIIIDAEMYIDLNSVQTRNATKTGLRDTDMQTL